MITPYRDSPISSIKPKKSSYMAIKTELVFTDNAGNRFWISLMEWLLVGHSVTPQSLHIQSLLFISKIKISDLHSDLFHTSVEKCGCTFQLHPIGNRGAAWSYPATLDSNSQAEFGSHFKPIIPAVILWSLRMHWIQRLLEVDKSY